MSDAHKRAEEALARYDEWCKRGDDEQEWNDLSDETVRIVCDVPSALRALLAETAPAPSEAVREDIPPDVPPATTEAEALIRLAYDARFGGHDWQRRAYSYLWRDRAPAPSEAVREAAHVPIPEGDLGWDAVAYAREVVGDPDHPHRDRDALSGAAIEVIAGVLSGYDRMAQRLNTLQRRRAEDEWGRTSEALATAYRESLKKGGHE